MMSEASAHIPVGSGFAKPRSAEQAGPRSF